MKKGYLKSQNEKEVVNTEKHSLATKHCRKLPKQNPSVQI
jgi:hypothetical protein